MSTDPERISVGWDELLQVPGWIAAACVLAALWEWAGLRPWMAALLFAVYVAKDAVMYPFVRRAYERGAQHGGERLVGAIGVVQRRLEPRGYVKINGELWRAENTTSAALEPGTRVRITAVRGLTLEVVPDPEARRKGGPS